MKKLLALFVLISFGALARAERIYLSGTGIDDPATWELRVDGGMNAGRWKKVAVPSSWETQGFGEYTYGRYYTVKGSVPSTEKGDYRTTFSLPKLKQGERVKIFFDGVMTDCEVSVNGRPAGQRHQGGFYRFSYDITPLVKSGKNRLDVAVWKASENKSINAAERKADWWLFGGIYRPVWLEIVPEVNIAHINLFGDHTGRLQALITTEGDARSYSVEIEVAGQKFSSSALQDGKIAVVGTVEGVQTWSPENPKLYPVKVSLLDPNGKTVQTKELKTGFRTVEVVAQDGIYLNGRKIVLKGVNRHSFSTDGGRATSPRLSHEDAELIKSMNMNAVRSHYPPDEHFLDACDSIGLLYIDELAGWHDKYDDRVAPRLVGEMVERDLNHPCVAIWSNGNEGGWNTKVDSLFAKYDVLQKRTVIHPWADWGDIDTHHYPTYLTGVGRFTGGYRVFMPTEFMHAMYDQGGGAGLRDFWDRWKTNPMFAGGFIWAFTDEAPRRSDRGGQLDSDRSNAPDGLLGPRREKEGSFYAVREQWSPVQIRPLLITPRFDGRFLVANESDETNLGDCRMEYRVEKVPTPNEGDGPETIASGLVSLPDIAPGETATASFSLPDNFFEGDLLWLSAFSPDGRCVLEKSFPVRLARQYFTLHNKPGESASSIAPEAGTTDGRIVLKQGETEVSFDPVNGRILKIQHGDSVVPLTNGPRAVGGKIKYLPERSSVRTENGAAVFCARYNGVADSIVWRLTSDGRLEMDALMLNRSKGGGGFDDAFMDSDVYNFGLVFDYPEEKVGSMAWMGRGPYRVWKNRLAGANYGLWKKAYNNTITGESYENLVYPEFKGYHGNMYWARFEGNALPWTVYSLTDGLYYQVFTPDEPEGRESQTMPDFPDGDISFLLEIPAIRSFKPIEQQGPNSQPGNIRIKSGDQGLRINLVFDFSGR